MSNYSFSYMLRASDLYFVYLSESISEVLGYEVGDLLNRAGADILFHPDERDRAIRTLNETAANNKAACLVYLQLFHRADRFEDCVMAQSAVGDVIVGSISLAVPAAAEATARNQSAEGVIVLTESVRMPANVPVLDWSGPRLPRTAFMLDRFSSGCTITHCTNAAILDPETSVNHSEGLFRYISRRDEQAARTFITNLKRSGIGAGNGIFAYINLTMCTTGRDLRAPSQSGSPPRQDEVRVSVVGSATSDGLILVVRRNN